MEKAVSAIEEWLQDCDTNAEADHLNLCLENDQDCLIHAIFSLFDEKSRYPELFENTVKQLFVLARSKDEKLRDFVLLFVPSLIYLYLSAVSMGDKKSVSSIEITLVALYNTEVLSEKGVTKVASFRLPTLARQSIYHEPASLGPTSYTTDSLHRLEAGDAETVRWGPPKHMTTVTAATRYHLATALLVAFNARLSKLPKVVLVHLCKATSKLVCQGFSRPGHHHRSSYGSDGSFGVYPRPIPRIPVTSDLLAELVHAVYFAIRSRRSLHDLPTLVSFQMALSLYHYNRFNDLTSLGVQSLEDVHMRSQYELFADVLLMTNAIKNSLKVNPSGQPSDAPMGISIALAPSANSAPLSKSYITNASFRTKKLPDDLLDYSDDTAEPQSTRQCEEVLQDLPSGVPLVPSSNVHSKARTGSEESPANKRSPQMGISSLKLKSPEVLKMFYRSEGKSTEDSSSHFAAKENSFKFDSHSFHKHSNKTSANELQNDYVSDLYVTSPSKVSEKNSGGKDKSSRNSSPLSDSKLAMFLKSRKAFSPFQNLSSSPKSKNLSVKSPEDVVHSHELNTVSFTRHTRTQSDCPGVKTVFLSSSTPNSPTLIRRYISTVSYQSGEENQVKKL